MAEQNHLASTEWVDIVNENNESCVSHGPFALQEEEVSEVCWLTPEEITARCDEFTPDSLKALALWMTRNAGNEYDDAEESERE